MSFFIKCRSSQAEVAPDQTLVEDLKTMVDRFNVLAHSFRRVHDFLIEEQSSNLCLTLFRNRSRDAKTYNLPTSDEVAALIVGDFDSLDAGRDIIVRKSSGQLTKIHETHPAFIPLQYPLLFLYGEDGYRKDIPLQDCAIDEESGKRTRVSLREFIAFRIQERNIEFGNVLNSGQLFQQFVVDCYTMIEAQRLFFIRMNQKVIRSDILNGTQEVVLRGENDPTSVGKRIVLPASFTGGMRYMFNNCQDAMTICNRFGYPDLFITITCNAN